ncbi:MAG: hypothetical protein WKF84_09910 [Pyrinomonadaceae bacterium]
MRDSLQYARLVQVPTSGHARPFASWAAARLDFVVKRGSQVVAGTLSANIKSEWEDAGWGRKLNEAVKSSSNKFTGPLTSPREPWHYSYVRSSFLD